MTGGRVRFDRQTARAGDAVASGYKEGPMETVVRIPEHLYAAIRAEVGRYAKQELETFLFLMLTRVQTPIRRLYLARSVVLLEEKEVVRHALRTFPTEAFCRRFYGDLKAAGVFQGDIRVGALHSHPFARGPVTFSSTDLHSFKVDRQIFAEEFPGVEFLAVVVNRDVTAFDGLVVGVEGLSPIQAIQVIGTSVHQMWRTNHGGDE